MASIRVLICAFAVILFAPWIGAAAPQPSPAPANGDPAVSIQMEDYTHGIPEHPPKWVFDPKEIAEEYRGIVETRNRLDRTIIPLADFKDTKLRDILDFLSRKTGVWILAYPPGEPDQPASEDLRSPLDAYVTFRLENAPASEVLRYATTLCGYADLTFSRNIVATKTICAAGYVSQSAEFKAPAQFDGMPIKDYLLSRGVENFSWSKLEHVETMGGVLLATHSGDNLKRIAIILEGLAENPPKVRNDREIADSLAAWNNLEWRKNLELQTVISAEIRDAPLEKVVGELKRKVLLWVETCADTKARVTLSLKNVPVPRLLQAIAEQTHTRLATGLRFIAFVPEKQAEPAP